MPRSSRTEPTDLPTEPGFTLYVTGLDGIEPARAGASSPDGRTGTLAVLPGGPGDDSMGGTADADLITGAEGNDTLSGLVGADTLDGGIGDDSLVGAGGGDSLVGAEGNDTLNGGTGADTMQGGAGNDSYVVDHAGDSLAESGTATTEIDLVRASVSWTLGANFENLILTGVAVLDGGGNGRHNKLTGNAADNLLSGAGGNDTLNGGSGGRDMLFGGEGHDSLVGGADDDTVDGGNGRDTLNGGAGTDSLTGGAGNDTYFVDAAGDDIVESSAATTEIDTVRASLTWTLAANVERLVLTGTQAIHGSGNELDNLLVGNAAGNALNGLAGNDTLIGSAGADTLSGGSGDDRYQGIDSDDAVVELDGEGFDTVTTGLASFVLDANLEGLLYNGAGAFTGTGNAAANAITGGADSDTLIGADGDDSLLGGDGEDSLEGGAGSDLLEGGAGNDSYTGVDAGDTLAELDGGGDDLVTTALLSYTLPSEIERLGYDGGGASFAGTGNALANTLTGRASSNDTLDGQAGADTMTGFGGNDVYIVDDAADVVLEAPAGGVDEVRTTLAAFTLPADVERLSFVGIGGFAGTGASGNETLTGGAGNDTLDGATGADSLVGGTGNDSYRVDDVGDIVVETSTLGSEIDVVLSSVTFTLGSNLENLTLTGNALIDGTGNTLGNVINGNNNNNLLSGAAGNDSIVGHAGNDTLDGGAGNDTLNGSLNGGSDSLVGGTGNDHYIVSTGDIVSETSTLGTEIDLVESSIDWTLGANFENLLLAGLSAIDGIGNTLANRLTGNAAANALIGGSGNDTLEGADGDDTLNGGTGLDSVTGGAGADDFAFSTLVLDSLVDYDRLPDFVSGTDDLVFDDSVYLLDNDADLLADVLVRGAPGGWGTANEVVIFTANVGASILSTSTVIAAVGPASAPIAVGDRKLFAIDDGTQTSVWLFRSDAADATVSATELTLVAHLIGTASTSSLDYLLIA